TLISIFSLIRPMHSTVPVPPIARAGFVRRPIGKSFAPAELTVLSAVSLTSWSVASTAATVTTIASPSLCALSFIFPFLLFKDFRPSAFGLTAKCLLQQCRMRRSRFWFPLFLEVRRNVRPSSGRNSREPAEALRHPHPRSSPRSRDSANLSRCRDLPDVQD